MKTLKNNKGFTLIELLAVIVVLAIVMAMMLTTVLPLATKARKDAFATEVNGAISAAGEEMTMIAIDTHRHNSGLLIPGDDYQRVVSGDTTKYCFSIKKLVELGFLKKSQKALEKDYAGYVLVESTKGSNIYKYSVKMHNTQYYVDETNNDELTADNVKDYTADGNISFNCSEFK